MALTDENGGNFNVSMPVQPMGGVASAICLSSRGCSMVNKMC